MTVRAVRNITTPNYPIAPDNYDRRHQDQFTNVLRLFSNTVTNAINAPRVFGSFYDTSLQSNPVASAVNLMKLNSTVYAYNTEVGSPTSRVIVGETGIYNIQFSAQLSKAAGASPQSIYIWLRVNGVNVPASTGQYILKDSNSEIVASWNYVIAMEANDYFELAWSSPDTDIRLKNLAATATVPLVPSVIVTVTWVSNVPL